MKPDFGVNLVSLPLAKMRSGKDFVGIAHKAFPEPILGSGFWRRQKEALALAFGVSQKHKLKPLA